MGRAFRAALALFLCLFSGGAFAAPAAAEADRMMPVGAVTLTPIGWIMFCQADSSECRVRNGEDKAPAKTGDELMKAVSALNARVNKAIRPVTDRVLYGVEERWTYPKDKGDCEDFALEKRKLLNEEAGIAMSDLLMTVVRKPNGEGHAILTLRTDEGDYVLDNLDKDVRLWRDTNYTFVKRQSVADPNVWLSIVSDEDLAVGSLRK